MSLGIKKCCASGCKTSSHDTNLSLFRFPKDEPRCSLWKRLLGNPEYYDLTAVECYNRLRLCSLHFRSYCFSSMQNNRLKRDAVPTFDSDDPVYDSDEGEDLEKKLSTSSSSISSIQQQSASIWDSDEECHLTKRQKTSDGKAQTLLFSSSQRSGKECLKQTVNNSTERLPDISAEDVGKFVEEQFSENFFKFVKMHIPLLENLPNEATYTNEYKQFALALYFLGPETYNLLHRIFRLPSKTTLHEISNSWEIHAGFSDFIFAALKLQVDLLDEVEKDCALCVDEMPINSHLFYDIAKDEIIGFHEVHSSRKTEPATHALVIMARGINSSWKQPIAYFFFNSACSVVDDLKEILFESVNRLSNIGLNVMAIISNQGSNFYKLVRNVLQLSVPEPYFYVGTKKIFYLFDVPHLLKSTRNNFFLYKFFFSGGATDKTYLEQLFTIEKDKQYRLASKLTSDHIFPANVQRTELKYASQVFSYSVAAAMQSYIGFNVLPARAVNTAVFIEKMDKLFDLLNSSGFTDCKEFNKPFVGSKAQVNFLNEMQILFKTLLVKKADYKNITKSMKFIFGWGLTISSVLQIWELLKNKNVKYLFTRNLCLDCLENYFTMIRNACGNAKNPTPVQFSKAFRELFARQYFEYRESVTCLEDFDKILSVMSPDLIDQFKCLLPTPTSYNPLKLESRDYMDITSSDENALVYFSGYFMEKCLQKHTCEICMAYVKLKTELGVSNIVCHLRANEIKKEAIIDNVNEPSYDFLSYLVKLDYQFVINFNGLALQKGTGFKLKEQFANVKFNHPCPNFPYNYFLSLFTRVRLYYTIKFANRELQIQKSNKQPSKLMMLQQL